MSGACFQFPLSWRDVASCLWCRNPGADVAWLSVSQQRAVFASLLFNVGGCELKSEFAVPFDGEVVG